VSSPSPSPKLRAAVAALAAVVLAVAALAAALLVADRTLAEPGPPLGAVLDDADRRALDAVPVRRGPPPAPADPAVDLTDPVTVARTYLAAARSAGADDQGHTHLRAASYALPGSPPAAVGVVVLDPPPPGQVRTASVTALELVAADEADQRRGYRATVTTTTGPAGFAASTARTSTAYVVLVRRPDGGWLVASDAPDTADPLDAE
jgi:hypothetical protein